MKLRILAVVLAAMAALSISGTALADAPGGDDGPGIEVLTASNCQGALISDQAKYHKGIKHAIDDHTGHPGSPGDTVREAQAFVRFVCALFD